MNSLALKVLFTGVLVTSMAPVATSQEKDSLPYPILVNKRPLKVFQDDNCSHAQAFEYGKITYQNTVSSTDYNNIPQWNAETEEPAISFGKVAKSARQFLRSLKLDDEPELLESIILTRFCGTNWVYVITYLKKGPEKVVQLGPEDYRVLGKRMYLYMRPDGVFIAPVEQSRLKVNN